MIAHLRGKLIGKQPNQAIVEAGGVGYDVTISVSTFSDLPQEGAEVALFIHTHVREDALALFGFLQMAEKQLFERLISVSGIGPKLAITVLSGMSAESLIAALRAGDAGALTRIPGIGKKTAERMVLELRDKVEKLATGPASISSTSQVDEDVISALVNLGYQRAAAEKAIASARTQLNGAGVEFEKLFRATMGALNR